MFVMFTSANNNVLKDRNIWSGSWAELYDTSLFHLFILKQEYSSYFLNEVLAHLSVVETQYCPLKTFCKYDFYLKTK